VNATEAAVVNRKGERRSSGVRRASGWRPGRGEGRALVLVAGLILGLAVAGVDPAAAQERPGTLSLGIQGQYGLIFGASDFSEDYDNGAGFGIRIRYALGGPQAFGISFESQTFGPGADTGETIGPDRLKLANITVEYLRYFNRGEGRSQYAVFGGGLYHPSDVRDNGQIAPASDGLILVAGGGAEIFVRRTTAVDLSVRFNGLLGGDAFSATVEAAAGFHFDLIK
jgi:hypothetical protein